MPVSYLFYSHKTQQENKCFPMLIKRIASTVIILLSVFAFTATQLVKDRSVYFENEYKFSLSKSKIENILKQTNAIKKLKIRRDDEVFPRNEYPNVEVDLNTFFVDFYLEHQICETKNIKFSFLIEQKKDFSIIRAVSADYVCELFEDNSINHNSLENQHKQELIDVFEREVIEKLRQNNSP
ncbi:MAG TPA: hypothetical protein VK892_03065 [Pyrinomonadaceae bacterium]|nr:hypothetical protein [Pyrinomonadaceae bacterium]